MTSTTDEHNAKTELLRLQEYLEDPVLLIGGLAVQQYHRARASRDIDLVCTLEQLKTLESNAYPSQTYAHEESQNDLRPNVVYQNLITGVKIYLGPKILEREPYPFIHYKHYTEDARWFTYDDKVCGNILVPSPHHLAFSKLISHISRRQKKKGEQDLSDFCNLSNHKDFSLNYFLAYITKVKAEEHVSKHFSDCDFTEDELTTLRSSAAFRVNDFFGGLRTVKHKKSSDQSGVKRKNYSRPPQKQTPLSLNLPRGQRASDERHRLTLSEMYYGSTDVNFELDSASEEALDLFYETYYPQPGLSIEDFFSGRKYLVHGLKGTGKTCFLRYMEQKILRESLSETDPELFRFRNDFPDLIYNDVRRAFHKNADFTSSQRAQIYRDLDYEHVWIYTLLRQVAHRIDRSPNAIFKDNNETSKFLRLISCVKKSAEKETIYRFLPNLSDGNIALSGTSGSSPTVVPFGSYVDALLQQFRQMVPQTGGELYFLLDEIEPRTGSALFEVDCILIRDLIGATKRLNSFRKGSSQGVFFIAAIRSEVLDKAQLLGEHIVKIIEHYGVSVNWGDLGSINIHHPLIKMICQKIAASERRYGQISAGLGSAEEDVWPRYFRKSKREQLSPKLFLDKTWHRPRDIVRLLDACKNTDANSNQISESLLSRSENRYSNAAWQFDVSQHLLLSIDPFAIEGLVEGLTGIDREISISAFEARLKMLSKGSTSVERLLTKYPMTTIVNSLYDAGIVGTKSSRTGTRFVFRGNTDPDLTGMLIIHPGLWKRFSVLSGRRGK